jgi:hypothetical protein
MRMTASEIRETLVDGAAEGCCAAVAADVVSFIGLVLVKISGVEDAKPAELSPAGIQAVATLALDPALSND